MKKSIPYTSNQEMIDEALKVDMNNVVLHHEGYVISIADHKFSPLNGPFTREIAVWKKDEGKRVGGMEVVARFNDSLESFEAALTLAKDYINDAVGGGG